MERALSESTITSSYYSIFELLLHSCRIFHNLRVMKLRYLTVERLRYQKSPLKRKKISQVEPKIQNLLKEIGKMQMWESFFVFSLHSCALIIQWILIKELKEKLGGESFDVIYDMNGRESSDTAPLADLFNGKVEHFVYMSSAGVYKKSPLMPHVEVRSNRCSAFLYFIVLLLIGRHWRREESTQRKVGNGSLLEANRHSFHQYSSHLYLWTNELQPTW